LHEERSRELERIQARQQIEVNHLEMNYRNKEEQMNDFKEEIKRKERDEATKTAVLIGQLERENDALKEEIEQLKKMNSNINTAGAQDTNSYTQNVKNDNAVCDKELNMVPESPNSAMNSPCYGDVSSLLTAVKMRRSTMSVRSPLSSRFQQRLQVESDVESLKQELEKYKMDIISYQTQLDENKEKTRELQEQVQETQIQRKKALDEREVLMQVIGVYEIMTATKINCLRGGSSVKGKPTQNVDTTGNGASNHATPDKEMPEEENEKKNGRLTK